MWKEQKKEAGLDTFLVWIISKLIALKMIDIGRRAHKVTGSVNRSLSVTNLDVGIVTHDSIEKPEILGNGYKLDSNGYRLPKWFRYEP